jgi:serine/threonine-protein kinase
MPAAGDVIGGRFRLDALVGAGGMGAVFRATDLENDDDVVALKFLKPSDGGTEDDESGKRRMRREARAAMTVKHPNVVRVHDVIDDEDGSPIIVMEFLLGETLQARLVKSGPLDVATFARIFLPVLSAVGTAHALGVVHRDLKPENVWLTKDGDKPRVLDFGIAKMLGPNATESSSGAGSLTTTGGVLGTPRYMAPEQVFGDKDVDHRVDVWSAGVIAYEALSGKRPIDGDNVFRVVRAITTGEVVPLDEVALGVPPALSKIIMRMLAVDRSKRPDDLRDLFDALRPHSDVEAPEFPHTPAVHTDGNIIRTVRRREGRVIFFAATVALLLGGAGILSHLARPAAAIDAIDASPTATSVAPSASIAETHEPAPPVLEASVPAVAITTARTQPKPSASVAPSASASAITTATATATTATPSVDPFHGLAVDAPF